MTETAVGALPFFEETQRSTEPAEDLLEALRGMKTDVRNRLVRFAYLTERRSDAEAIEKLIAWSLNPDNIDPDATEILRAEAWSVDLGE